MEPSQDNKSTQRHAEWENLHPYILGDIYTFLGRKDQLIMSHVCSKWRTVYESSPLWNTFTFRLAESDFDETTFLCTKLVEKFGGMFRHVKLDYSHAKLSKWCKYFREFLLALTKSNPKLESVEFLQLKDLLSSLDYDTYKETCRAIAYFLESQNELKQVKFLICHFKIRDGVDFLRQVVRKYRESLRYLGLREFVSYETLDRGTISDFAQHLPMLCDLPNLTTLDVDYSLVFSNMFSPKCFETLKKPETPVPAFSKIILLYKDAPETGAPRPERSEFRGLISSDWLFLKTLLPKLHVELTIQTHLLTSNILKFLITPNIPITRLKYAHGSVNTTIKLIAHVCACQTNDHITSLHLGIYPSDADVVSPLGQILPAFKKLKFLELNIPVSTNISDLIEHWRGNPLEYLEKVVIHITDVRNEGVYRVAQNLRSIYVSQLKSISMNVAVDIIEYVYQWSL